MIGDVIQITGRIGRLIVDGRRRDLIADRQHRDSRLQAAGAAQKMSRHRFRRTYRHLVGMVAKAPANGQCLGLVADLGGRAVGVDVIDLLRFKPRVAQRSYEANVTMIEGSRSLIQRTIDLLRS